MKIIIETHQGEILTGRILIHRTYGDILTMKIHNVYNLTIGESIVSIFEYPSLTGNVIVTKYMIADGNSIGGLQ